MRQTSTGFKIEDIITKEERAVAYGIANGMEMDKKSINAQLIEARKLNK